MSAHAKLSASGSHRWMNCAGSIALSDTVPQKGSSPFAMEGTAAHHLGEHCLEKGTDASDRLGDKIVIGTDGFAYWPDDYDGKVEATFVVDEDMAEAVQVYLDHVRTVVATSGEDAQLHLEQRFDLSWLRKDMFGTGDATVVPGAGCTILDLTDYKHGRGVVVEPEENSQLMYYGLGALRDFGDLALVDRVRLTIVQPRAPHPDGPVRSWEIDADELMAWGTEILGPAADATRKKNAPFSAGEWCRFCPAAHICEELKGEAMRAASLDFDDPDAEPEIPQEATAVSEAMAMVPVVDAWAKAVSGRCGELLEAGTPVPGFKLVRKKSNRAWKDEAKAIKTLKTKRVKAGEMYKPQVLKSPAQLEKVKSVGKSLVAELCHKPPGGLTVASEGDPRSAEQPSAVTDFKED